MNVVSVIKGEEIHLMLKNAIYLCGGLSKLLPDREERILIKPNFGCHKSAVTGATTDLRVLIAIIELLQNEGYSNITVGDGGMAGYLDLDIMDHLGVPEICGNYGVPVIDLNRDEGIQVRLTSGATVRISKTALKSQLINLPKLKTHVLTTVTLGVKNLMGCVIGFDKRKVHLHGLNQGLAGLPKAIDPCFTIIDGLIGMEGRGPVAGNPVRTDVLIVSQGVLAADIIASRIIGFDPSRIEHIRGACATIDVPISLYEKTIQVLGSSIEDVTFQFEKPVSKALEANHFINLLKHMVRGTPLYNLSKTLLSFGLAFAFFRAMGLIQEGSLIMSSDLPQVDLDGCEGCSVCATVCPTNALTIVHQKAHLHPNSCVKCYCCVEICPKGMISC